MEKENWALTCAVFIDEHLKEELSVERISAWAGYSPWYFSRRFKAEMGVSPIAAKCADTRLRSELDEISLKFL